MMVMPGSGVRGLLGVVLVVGRVMVFGSPELEVVVRVVVLAPPPEMVAPVFRGGVGAMMVVVPLLLVVVVVRVAVAGPSISLSRGMRANSSRLRVPSELRSSCLNMRV